MGRSDSGNITEHTTISSVVEATSALNHPAVRTNAVQSFPTSSLLPPIFKTSITQDTFASIGGISSTTPAPSEINFSTKAYSQNRTKRKPFFPSLIPAHHCLIDFHGNQPPATQLFQGADVDLGQSAELL